MMKKLIICLCILLGSTICSAQNQTGADSARHEVKMEPVESTSLSPAGDNNRNADDGFIASGREQERLLTDNITLMLKLFEIALGILAFAVIILLVFSFMSFKTYRMMVLDTVEVRKKAPNIPSDPESHLNNPETGQQPAENLQEQTKDNAPDDSKQPSNIVQTPPAAPPDCSGVQENNQKKYYAKNIDNGKFRTVTDKTSDDTVYTLLLKEPDSRTAEFTIESVCHKRIIKCPDFIDGCDIERISDNPVALEVEKGSAVKQDDDRWLIKKKAKVKFV
jgi:hypothetical protein